MGCDLGTFTIQFISVSRQYYIRLDANHIYPPLVLYFSNVLMFRLCAKSHAYGEHDSREWQVRAYNIFATSNSSSTSTRLIISIYYSHISVTSYCNPKGHRCFTCHIVYCSAICHACHIFLTFTIILKKQGISYLGTKI